MVMEMFFYIFSGLLVFGSLGVVLSKSTIYSVLFLIFCFLNCAGLFILLKAEFLAMLLIIVYVGAVAVLFLFVIMMIGDRLLKKIYDAKILSFAAIISFIFFIELLTVIHFGFSKYKIPHSTLHISDNLTNIEAIGSLLYSNFMLPFEISGIILLASMVGSVLLTHRIRSGVKKQNMSIQLDRNRNNSIELVKIKSGRSVYDN